jgi:ABC-type maltose transport system permease subunit
LYYAIVTVINYINILMQSQEMNTVTKHIQNQHIPWQCCWGLQKLSKEFTKDDYVVGLFCDSLCNDGSLLQPLPSQTEHYRLVVHHCRNSSILSLFTAFLVLFQCPCVSYLSILVQFFYVDCDFSTHDVH